MSEQASLHLINLAGIHGLAKAREMLGLSPKPDELPAPVVTLTPAANPPDFVPPGSVEPSPEKSPEQIAAEQRAAEDEGAAKATAAQLKAALTQLGISFSGNAKKADLLALFIARP